MKTPTRAAPPPDNPHLPEPYAPPAYREPRWTALGFLRGQALMLMEVTEACQSWRVMIDAANLPFGPFEAVAWRAARDMQRVDDWFASLAERQRRRQFARTRLQELQS